MLLDGASSALLLKVDAALPAQLLAGRRVIVAGDGPQTWLVIGVFGASAINVAHGLVALDGSSNLNVAGTYRVAGTQVVGARGAAVVDAAATTTDLQRAVNEILGRLRAHGLIAP